LPTRNSEEPFYLYGANYNGGPYEQADAGGFSQRIQLAWFEYTADLVLTGCSRSEIEAALQELLKERLSRGRTAQSRGNREKAITILLKVWTTPPAHLRELRDDGLDLLRLLPREQHLPVHWRMTTAVYLFVAVVAEIMGRLLRLQDAVSQDQVQQRLSGQLGERETVARAVRRVMRCFIDWESFRKRRARAFTGQRPRKKLQAKS